MPLEREEPLRVSIQCVREVRLPVPRERLADIEAFYQLLFGLRAWPPKAQIPGGRGLGNPRCGMLLQFRHDPVIDANRARFSLIVNDLDRLARRLKDVGVAFERVRGFFLCDNCISLSDPAGHRVEVRQQRAI